MAVGDEHDSGSSDRDFILPRGITGFRHIRESLLPGTDFRAFVGCCHDAARSLSAKVLMSVAAHQRPPANFGAVALRLPRGTIDVIVNEIHPIVRFARPLDLNGGSPTFVDEPELAAALERTGAWQILPKAVLDGPVRPESLARLGPVERHQIEYWKPQRIGDIVFDLWD